MPMSHIPGKLRILARLLTAAILLILAMAALLWFTAERLDLRGRAQTALNKMIGPLTFRDWEFRFSPLPELICHDIHGTAAAYGVDHFEAASLHLHPQLRQLLHGQIAIDAIILKKPLLQIDQVKLREALARKNESSAHFPRVHLKKVRIDDGSVALKPEGGRETLKIHALDGHWLHKNNQVQLSGKIAQGQAEDASFSGSMSLTKASHWRDWTMTAQCHFQQLSGTFLTAMLALPDTRLDGLFDLQASAHGQPATGLAGKIQITGDPRLVIRDQKFPALAPLTLDALWISSQEMQNFPVLELRSPKMAINGTMHLKPGPQGLLLNGKLTSPLCDLAPWLPKKAQAFVKKGKAALTSCTFQGQLPQALVPIQLDARLEQLEIALPNGNTLKQGSGILHMTPQKLQMEKGRFTWNKQPLTFDAALEDWKNAPALTARAVVPLAYLGTLLPKTAFKPRLPATLAVELGALWKGKSNGVHLQLKTDIREILVKNGLDLLGKLFLEGNFGPEGWKLTKSELNAGMFRLSAAGAGKKANPRDFKLRLHLADLELASLAKLIPKLQRFRLQGQASADMDLSVTPKMPPAFSGKLHLNKAGMHIIDLLADLSNVSGTIDFTPNSASARNLSGQMGTSAMRASAAIGDFRQPQLRISLSSPKARADELVFRSDQDYVYNVHGDLVIQKDEILFENISVALKQGTKATVNGFVRHFGEPEVVLRIVSENAVIDEVIDLWKAPKRPKPREPGDKNDKDVALAIEMAVAKGSILGLPFHDAKGELHLRNKLVVIHPITLRCGQGYGIGQVIIDPHVKGPALLRISSHLEDFDAETLSTKLLRISRIATGRLRGDMLLECRADANFLPTSRGRFHGEIHRGVLKQFRIISKVFSLLNVSQLLRLKIPDMAKDGMPFTTVTASLSLDNGVLSSDDVLIDSEAMKLSMTGKADLVRDQVDAMVGLSPLGTLDSIINNIPIAGWVLGGKEQSFLLALFKVGGSVSDPQASMVPVHSLSSKAAGIFLRLLNLPVKIFKAPGEIINNQGKRSP